jgi:hypothetical protein
LIREIQAIRRRESRKPQEAYVKYSPIKTGCGTPFAEGNKFEIANSCKQRHFLRLQSGGVMFDKRCFLRLPALSTRLRNSNK